MIRHETRTLYCKSEAERDSWLSQLQHAAQVIIIINNFSLKINLTLFYLTLKYLMF